ncbi:MAG: Xaa-Pro peptidase family protein [Planctomycetota bacterium]
MGLVLPQEEFDGRIETLAKRVADAGLDAVLVHSDEADFANVRYLSDYWPVFERAAVVVGAGGKAVQVIGPESGEYALDRSRLKSIHKLVCYRESAEPDYPDIPVSNFRKVFEEACEGKPPKKVGVVGWGIFPHAIHEEMSEAIPGVKIVKADDLVIGMRMVKSPREIEMLKESFRVSQIAVDAVIAEVKPGMTELQAVGIAQRAFFGAGAESESHPQYCLAGRNSAHAISRPSHRVIKKGDLVQLDIGGRVAGYSGSIGRPICVGGKMTDMMKKLAEFGIKAHYKTHQMMQLGRPAREVATEYDAWVRREGFGEYLLYGPCHGLGLIEVERPWVEKTSTYKFQENMTFQIDTFFWCSEFGVRYENGLRIAPGKGELMSEKRMEVIEVK